MILITKWQFLMTYDCSQAGSLSWHPAPDPGPAVVRTLQVTVSILPPSPELTLGFPAQKFVFCLSVTRTGQVCQSSGNPAKYWKSDFLCCKSIYQCNANKPGQCSSLRLGGRWSSPNLKFSKLREIKQYKTDVHHITTTWSRYLFKFVSR